MQLQITKPTEKKNFDIVWIDLQTPQGNFVIQPEHAPMIITLLQNSMATYGLSNGKQESIKVINGIAHITRQEVTLLLND